ncbi:hypothetical protein D3C84_759110 [compost metagenome]
MITSGAWRRVFFSATSNDSVSMPTSRWVTMQPWCWWMNSMGSSMVMMWPWEFRLRSPIIAASEVDLPAPVPPTNSTRPRLLIDSCLSTSGSLSSSMVGMLVSMRRSTMPTRLRW